jgi:hypothetical protein
MFTSCCFVHGNVFTLFSDCFSCLSWWCFRLADDRYRFLSNASKDFGFCTKACPRLAVRQLSFCQFLSISTSVDLRSLRSAVSPTELDRSQEHSSMAPIVFGERLWGGIAGHQNSDHFEQSIWFRMFRFWRLGGTCFGFHVGFDAWNPTKTYNHPQSSTIRIHMETGGCSRDSHGIWAGLHGWRRSLA